MTQYWFMDLGAKMSAALIRNLSSEYKNLKERKNYETY